MEPRDLTIGDCQAARHSVTVWCGNGCPGRDLDLSKLERWSDRRIVDLAESGKLVCSRCGSPATFVAVSAHLVRDPILRWKKP